jgi:acetyl-CoA acetyltransferase
VTDRPERRAIISGLGLSRTGRKTGIPGIELTLEAARQAIADAGLTPADIDGVASLGDTPVDEVIQALSLDVRFRGFDVEGTGLHWPVISGFIGAGSGQARHVLVYRTVQMLGGSALQASGALPTTGPMADVGVFMPFHAYGASNWLSMHCRRHMHLYGTKKEQLGWLAVNSRRNAGLNPAAVFRDPITLDDYMASRPVSTPFSLLDCDVPMDGSIAMVISTEDYAKDCPKTPIRMDAFGGALGEGGWFRRADYPAMASVDAAKAMWSRTDLKARDIDFAELYDGFTFLTFAWLEALGLCGEGEAGPFVEGASRIALEGEMPLNTYGGQLSAGRMHGYWILHEACVQLRGEGGARQVKKPVDVAAVAAGGGPIACSFLLTR